MLGFRLKEILFGNWRNKGVALFFAVTIWMVAYQAETQKEQIAARLVPVPMPDGYVIVGQSTIDAHGMQVPFDGTVRFTVTGPRKQIEALRGDGRTREVRFPVEAGPGAGPQQKKFPVPATFGFVPRSVEVSRIEPDSLLISFDREEVKEFQVETVHQRVPEGMEAETTRIEPKSVKLRGPRSLLDGIKVVAEVWWGAADRFEDSVDVAKVVPEAYDRKVVDSTVRFVGPSRVRVGARLRYRDDSFDADGIRLRFLVPPRFPFQPRFDEETVRVRFQGPAQEIRRLRDRVKEPDFTLGLAVQAPPPGQERERTITLTEDKLLLHGFSDLIRILQHPDRADKGPWTYTLIPVPPPAKPAG
jgi:hypothetical protein